MKLTESHIEELKAAAERVGNYGKISLVVIDSIVDIITEDRRRLQNGKKSNEEAR